MTVGNDGWFIVLYVIFIKVLTKSFCPLSRNPALTENKMFFRN